MLRCQCKNTINNSKGNMFLLEPSYPTREDPEYSNIGENQEKYLKTT